MLNKLLTQIIEPALKDIGYLLVSLNYYAPVDKAKKEPRDLFIVKNIKHRYDIEEFEYKCEGGEVKIISPWKPNSPKSSLKAIDYKFCPEK